MYKRYFKCKLNDAGNAPIHIPEEQAVYTYEDGYCLVGIQDPGDKWLELALEEIPISELPVKSNNSLLPIDSRLSTKVEKDIKEK